MVLQHAEAIQTGDHWAYFGDGNAAQIIDSKEEINKKTGLKMVRFIFIPSERIERKFDIVDKQDPATRAIVKEYKWTDVIWLERGTQRTRCWVVTDFRGGHTPASRRYEELSTTLNDTDRLLRSGEAAKNRAYQELEKERQQQLQSMITKTEYLKVIAKARGRVDGESSDSDDDGSD